MLLMLFVMLYCPHTTCLCRQACADSAVTDFGIRVTDPGAVDADLVAVVCNYGSVSICSDVAEFDLGTADDR